MLPHAVEASAKRSPSIPATPIRGIARVVRSGADTAFEFVELGSSDENRVSDLVFGAREAALLKRLRSVSRVD